MYSDGLTEMPEERRERIAAELEAFTERDGDCIIWTGAVNDKGYGTIALGIGRKRVVAHRAAWLIQRGPIPEGLVLDHLCMRHPCVNVEHLEIVTQSENIRRAIAHHQAQGTGRWVQSPAMCRSGRHELTGHNRMELPRPNGRTAYSCRACNSEKAAEWRANNPERMKAFEKRRWQRTLEKRRQSEPE